MKKQVYNALGALALAAVAQPGVHALNHNGFFGPSFYDIMADAQAMHERAMRQHEEIMRAAGASLDRSAKAGREPDYALQNYRDGDEYTVIVKLKGRFATQKPVVSIINDDDRTTGKTVKKVQIAAGAPEAGADRKNGSTGPAYSCQTSSMSMVMENGVVTQNSQESSQAQRRDGILEITHLLPPDVEDEAQTVAFDEKEGQLKLVFKVKNRKTKATKKVLDYTVVTGNKADKKDTSAPDAPLAEAAQEVAKAGDADDAAENADADVP